MINIAIIDDELEIRELLENAMMDEFYSITRVFKFAKIKEYNEVIEHWNVIFLDYNISESIKGVDIAREIIKREQSDKICIITGESKEIIKKLLSKNGLECEVIEKGTIEFLDDVLDIVEELC